MSLVHEHRNPSRPRTISPSERGHHTLPFGDQTMEDPTLEELGLFDSEPIDDLDAPPVSPPSRSPIFDQAEWNLSPVGAGTDIFASDPRYPSGRNETNIVNAVHMHVQENARIPNYNRPVDRSNSISNRYFPRNNYSSDALFSSKPEQDNSMAEIFLSSESSNRKSLNQTYEVSGSLSTAEETFQKAIDELATISVDPTPWSQIQDKIVIEEEREKNQQGQQQQKQISTGTPVPASSIHPHQSSYYPYGRQQQLPIPDRSPLPRTETTYLESNAVDQGASRMAEALATAAAIARSSNDNPEMVDNNGNGPPAKESTTPYIPQPGGSNAKIPSVRLQPKTSQSGKASVDSNRLLQRQRGNANPPHHAAAHAVSRASVLAATNRKSQYGFGGNHIVPSVPAPPSIRSANNSVLQQRPVRKNKQAPKKTTATSPSKKHTTAAKIPLTIPKGRHPALPVETNTGSAYERKKQKAKDARVKLNESIERLAIAVSLAGSQSKTRIDQLQNEITTTEFREKSIAVNEEGIKLAENAKKWDRPSFVGTAASVIQSLNGQCEALMAELMALNKIVVAGNGNPGNVGQSESLTNGAISTCPTKGANTEHSNSKNEQAEGALPNSGQKRDQQPAGSIENVQSPNKRQRLAVEEPENLPRNDEVLFGSVAQMLDPVSLCRCVCTGKAWKELNAFKDENVWLNLAVKRFGVHNVRKWSENLKDGESEETISNKHLYEEMNASNVMPPFSQEGLSFLGNGRIKGKLSGWVFVVQRSNGETLRSVKRDPASGTSIGYQSRPVVELRIVVQNIGMVTQPIILKSQKVGVDVSTRRRGGEFEEIDWDDRFTKVVTNTDGTIRSLSDGSHQDDICQLELFETAVIEVHINARGCSTISKFRQRSNFTKILASLDGTTIPLVIPFLKHDGMF